ncbi:lipid A biosynthesis lauroyl acyltransferase [Photobacterium sanctipauli]|uniref:Lipid A biosynthesis acyltransferase n=1 Tax=Photobacterium sanctipauli TaxID=1342794 RepID=A0A2T3NZ19_9GAMM|nr:LpxL/LpxP family Kdo(2)-lipid IV(A) lauroyl/palmitoleoyl acyltransferase [Photobacterium sanctipauli]PSW21459.1 lipid A biosynthesis lauroyl acyltransferase [Photobacterium sanctipauli]
MSKSVAPSFSLSYLSPRYWPTLLMIGVMFLLSLLPYSVQFRLGQGLGKFLLGFMKKRRFTIERNLALCFPHLSEQARERMAEQNMGNSGLALFETGMAWFWSDARVKRHVKYEGMEHVEALEKQGKGALFIAVHSLNLELGARAFGVMKSGIGVQRANNNPCFNYFQCKGRSRSNRTLLDRKDVKGMLKALKTGGRVWYAPDHDYGLRRGTFAPLFAVENACTTMGTSLLVDSAECEVVPFVFVRDCDSGQYTVKILPPLHDFPRNEPEKAAAFINNVVEQSIMEAPEQYMWLHRRFKTRPEGEASLYGPVQVKEAEPKVA